MMTGKELYEITQEQLQRTGCIDWTNIPWDQLGAVEKGSWDQLAFEQDLRDRDLPEGLQEVAK